MATHERPESPPTVQAAESVRHREFMSVYECGSSGSVGITLPKVVKFHLGVTTDDSVEIQVHKDGIWIPTND